MPIHPSAILQEVQQLYDVSDRLDVLAEQHPLVSEARQAEGLVHGFLVLRTAGR